MKDNEEVIFHHNDSLDGGTLLTVVKVGPDRLSLFAYDPSRLRPDCQIRFDRQDVRELYAVLGAWMGEPGRVEAPEPEPERTVPASTDVVSKMIWAALRVERESVRRFVESKLEEAFAVDQMPDAWRAEVEQVAGTVARDVLGNALTAAVREVN